MKTSFSKTAGGLLAAAFVALSTTAPAQVVVTETATTGYGTISQYSPGQTLVVTQEAGPANYYVTKQTTFVDEAGTPVEASYITSGAPITVNYVREGDRMVASRVVVKKTVATTPGGAQVTRTTTTNSTSGAGTISEFSPGSNSIVLRSASGAAPLTYGVSSSTTYVDENGNPVAVEKIAPGVPVTVQYVREGDRMIANRVVVTRTTTTTTAPTRPLTKDEREDLKDRQEDAREEAKDARKDAKERREEAREDAKDRRD
ncbi:MAG: hypothetical protein ACAI34_07605 [Verrucomicrobium sp.]